MNNIKTFTVMKNQITKVALSDEIFYTSLSEQFKVTYHDNTTEVIGKTRKKELEKNKSAYKEITAIGKPFINQKAKKRKKFRFNGIMIHKELENDKEILWDASLNDLPSNAAYIYFYSKDDKEKKRNYVKIKEELHIRNINIIGKKCGTIKPTKVNTIDCEDKKSLFFT